jgi:hypothetical protein
MFTAIMFVDTAVPFLTVRRLCICGQTTIDMQRHDNHQLLVESIDAPRLAATSPSPGRIIC